MKDQLPFIHSYIATDLNCHFNGRHTDTQTDTQTAAAIGNNPPQYAHVPLPVLRSHTPGAAPGLPVKTWAHVRLFRGCKKAPPFVKLYEPFTGDLWGWYVLRVARGPQSKKAPAAAEEEAAHLRWAS